MTPNIVSESAKVKFDAADFVWVDLGNTPEPTDEQYRKMIDLDIGSIFSSKVKDIPMPFEKFVVVRTLNSGKPLSYTFERENDKVIFKLRSHEYESIAEAWQEEDQIYARCLDVFLEACKKNNPETDLDHVRKILISMAQAILGTISLLSLNKNESIKAFKCENLTNNQKRRAKGKKPLYEWKTIDLKPSIKSESLGGSHASPRGHLRRGHPRRLKSGKIAWVKQCKVGDFSKGFVFHDYKSPNYA